MLSAIVLEDGALYGEWSGCQGGVAEGNVGVVAIDATTGLVRWRTPGLVTGETAPGTDLRSALDGVYVAKGDAGAGDGPTVLVGVDAQTGAERWRTEVHPGSATTAPTVLD